MKDYLKKYFAIIGDKKKYLLVLVVFFLVSSLLDLIGIGLVGPFISVVTVPEKIIEYGSWHAFKSVLGIETETQGMLALGGIIVAAFYAKGYIAYQIYRKIIYFSYGHQGDLRSRLMACYQAMPYHFHIKRNTASLINMINNHTSIYTSGTLVASLRMVADLIVFSAISILLIVTNYLAAIGMIVLLGGVFFFYTKTVKKRIKETGTELAESNKDIIKHVAHGMGGLKEIRVLGREDYFFNKVREKSLEYASAGSEFYSMQIIPRYLIESAVITFVVLLACLTVVFTNNTAYMLATLGIFGVAAIRLMPSFIVIMSGVNNLRNSYHVLNELYEDLTTIESGQKEPIIKQDVREDRLDTRGSDDLFQNISVVNVSYKYPESYEYALDDISLNIKSGQCVGLIGRSGSGKTTLVDILLGLLTPESGDVCIDGQSIYSDLRSWLDHVAYIPQDVFVVDDSLRRNIALGVEDVDIDDKEISNALDLSQLRSVVKQLPNGLDTVLGENGVRLSGGQRQRVALARAFYHQREIIIMDEATSALDNETEKEVINAIDNLKGKKTLIVIAHRLTTIERSDVIYRMQEGRIVDSGDYQQVVGFK